MKIIDYSRKTLLDQYQFICLLISAPSVFCQSETVSLCFLMRNITEGLSTLWKVSCCMVLLYVFEGQKTTFFHHVISLASWTSAPCVILPHSWLFLWWPMKRCTFQQFLFDMCNKHEFIKEMAI